MADIEEYLTKEEMADIGLEQLIPAQYRNKFPRREADGSFKLPDKYRDLCNSHGFGASYIDQLSKKKGTGFIKALKEPTCKAKYTQNQINDMSAAIRRNEELIRKL